MPSVFNKCLKKVTASYDRKSSINNKNTKKGYKKNTYINKKRVYFLHIFLK